jgi:cytochrome c oxidase cbb3-type subunit 3
MRPIPRLAGAALIVGVAALRMTAQPAPAAPQPPQQRPGDFPSHQRALAAPEVIERGSTLYGIHCRLCHGPDLRGGDMGGVNLLRSQLVLSDQNGELIGPVVMNGKSSGGGMAMPPVGLGADDVKAVVAFIQATLAKAARQGGPPPGPPVVLNIVVGDPAAGQQFFAANCASCHSVTGDLQGLAARYAEPMQLQNAWVSGSVGGGGRRGGFGPAAAEGPPGRTPKPVTVAVTTATGQHVEGRLERIDDFIVVLTEADGTRRSFRRTGASLDIQITDPLAGHKKLFVKYTDKDIHDVTAYLVTLK